MNSPDYQKGYAAGRRRVAAEIAETEDYLKRITTAEIQIAAQIMAAFLTGPTTWNMDGKKVSSLAGYADLAKRGARELMGIRR